RCGRCAGDLERGSATRDALGAVKERTAASHALAAPSARAVDQSENANGQRLAWAALRVWGAVARRSTSGSEGHYCQPRRDRREGPGAHARAHRWTVADAAPDRRTHRCDRG